MPEPRRCRPVPFTTAELARAAQLRARWAGLLPPDFDSDFFLCRWLRAHRGDEPTLRARLDELLEHRRALGYDERNILDFCRTFPVARQTFERFSISQLKMDVFSGDVAVFVQKMEGSDIKEIMKVMPLSNVLHSYFFLHECFHRAMHRHERETGRQAAVCVVLDLHGLNLADFINPLSVSSKLARLVVKIWSDYFSENMIGLFLLHPPALLSLMWQVAKHIVDDKTRSRIVFIQHTDDLFQHLSRDAVPAAWGGERHDAELATPLAAAEVGGGDDPDVADVATTAADCVSAPRVVRAADHFVADRFWAECGVRPAPALRAVALKSGARHDAACACRAGQLLSWLFTIGTDCTFQVVHVSEADQTETVVWPKVTLTSLRTPEVGRLRCERAGTYRARFQNVGGSWLASKLHYALQAS